jgi:peroxiredoxin
MRGLLSGNYTGVGALIGLGMLMFGCAGADNAPLVPNYQDALAQFQAESKNAKDAPKLTEQDRRIMQDAGAQLAAAMPEPGLKVGARAPDFSLKDAQGNVVTLSEALKQGPVILAFYRGAWCPYCNLQLKLLSETLPQFMHYGAQLIAVTPQLPDKSLKQVNKAGYPFAILSDLDSQVMRDYNLYFEVPPELSEVYKHAFGLDLADYNGAGRYVLPVPGTFVIDSRGIIRGAFAKTDYTQRMEPSVILEILKTMPVVTVQ